jgi:hypothetical protein
VRLRTSEFARERSCARLIGMSSDQSGLSGCSIIPSLRRVYAGVRIVLSKPSIEVERLRRVRVGCVILADSFCRGCHISLFQPHIFHVTVAKPFGEVFPSTSISCWSSIKNLFNFVGIVSFFSFLNDHWGGLCVTGSVFRRFDVWREEGRVEDRVDARMLPCLWDVKSIRYRSQLSGYGEQSKSLGVEFCLGSLST